jgi:hypothetical protein
MGVLCDKPSYGQLKNAHRLRPLQESTSVIAEPNVDERRDTRLAKVGFRTAIDLDNGRRPARLIRTCHLSLCLRIIVIENLQVEPE